MRRVEEGVGRGCYLFRTQNSAGDTLVRHL